MNRYNVIHIDVQWCIEPAGGTEKVVSFITKNVISELQEKYGSVLPNEVESLPNALSYISAATGKKFIIIMDEWDVLIREEAVKSEGYRRNISIF